MAAARSTPSRARPTAPAVSQASTASNRPVILHYDTKAGHSRGATPIPKQIDDLTDELSFLFAETNPMAQAAPAMKKAS